MALELTCPQCGCVEQADASFCSECGHDFASDFEKETLSGPEGAPPAQPSPPARSGGMEPSGPRLRVSLDGSSVSVISLGDTPVTIGRDTGNDIQVNLPQVSRVHARVIRSDGGFGVVDLGSTNGTFVRGQRIPPMQPRPLASGDELGIGDQAGSTASITYVEDDGKQSFSGRVDMGETRLAGNDHFTIGRDPQSDLPLQSPVVSWHHAEVVQTEQGHYLNDPGSTNGTFVNGYLVRQALLKVGDQVQIGPYKLVYDYSGFRQYSSVGSVRLDAIGLLQQVPTSRGPRVILNNISLTVMPREFVALVGGSGAGKTTLMDALNGFRRVQQGQVLLNGDDFYHNYDAYRSNIGYVPQDDILHTGLPVDRALRYTARLRLPLDTTPATIEERIDQVLQQVEMLPQKQQAITSLSGGQRKRVSIAAELLSDPSLIFLDEPTSGLDPGLDRKMMGTLKQLADSGRTIVLTTHATSNISQCHQVAFLAHGRLVYYGPPALTPGFFQVNDFAYIYDRLETPQLAQQWESSYQASPQYQEMVIQRHATVRQAAAVTAQAPPAPPRINARASWRQFGILSRRYLDIIFNDRMSMFLLLAVMPIIALLFLLIANGSSFVGDSAGRINEIMAEKGFYMVVTDSQKLLLMMALAVILLGVFAGAYEIVKEKPVYRRERMVNLRIIPYLSSKLLVLMGFGLLQCLALLVILGLKVSFPGGGAFIPAVLEIYVTLFLSMLAGLAIGLFISALVRSANMVIYLMLVVLMVQIIFSGALFELPNSVEPVSYVTPTRWAVEGLGASVDMDFLNGRSQRHISEIDGRQVNETVNAPVDFEINYDSNAGHLLQVWLLQVMFACLFFCLAALTLKRQDIRS